MRSDKFFEITDEWENYNLVRVYKEKKELAKFICAEVNVTDKWIHMKKVHLIVGKEITEASIAYSSTFTELETINIETMTKEKLKSLI